MKPLRITDLTSTGSAECHERGPEEKRRVHVTGDVPRRVAEALEQDFELVAEPAGAEEILSLINTVVDDAYLERAGPQLEVVANYGVGVNNVDLEEARRVAS